MLFRYFEQDFDYRGQEVRKLRQAEANHLLAVDSCEGGAQTFECGACEVDLFQDGHFVPRFEVLPSIL